jgi:ryanodine receptor 2
VRTLIAYGYNLEAPTGDAAAEASALINAGSQVRYDFRSYRAEKTYAVTTGKWYFEVEILTTGNIRLGWANVLFSPSCELGGDEHSWAFDCCNARKAYSNSVEAFGKQV